MQQVMTTKGLKVKTGNSTIDSIYNEPEKWHVNEHYFYHDSGFNFWIANGRSYFKPKCGSFGFWDNRKAWKAYNWWMRNKPVDHT